MALALLLGTPALAQDQTPPDVETGAEAEAEVAAEPMTKGEKQLARMLEGRVAGEPVRCIRTFPNQRMETIDKTAYVFGTGTTIFVQRTRNPEQIDRNDALITQRFNATQMCKLDVMTTVDPVTGIFTGVVFFEDFVPYTKVKDGNGKSGRD